MTLPQSYDNFIHMKQISTIRKEKFAHLVLIRHGESLYNRKGLWTGWHDISLSAKGKREAKMAASVLRDIKFHMAFTSDLKRAHETLEIIKTELSHFDLPTVRHHAYKERHYGIYTGKSKWEISNLIGEEKFRKLRRAWDEPIPKGETLKNVYERVIPHFSDNVLPQLKKGRNILIVAHGNSHRALIKYLENLSHEAIAEVEMATGEVIVYKLDFTGKVIHKEKRFINKKRGKQ